MNLGERRMHENCERSNATGAKEKGWRKGRRGGLGFALSIGLVVTMMIAAGSVHATSPNGPNTCTCACYNTCGGGNCPTPYTLTLTVFVQGNSSTNATISWWVSTSSAFPDASTNVTWGNSTSYPFTAASNLEVGQGSGSGSSAFLDYLQPSKTYDYKIVGWSECSDSSGNHFYRDTITGSWVTNADPSETISGRVVNPSGTPAPSGMELMIRCAESTGYGIDYPSTGTGGYFSVQLLGSLEDCAQAGGYLVTALPTTTFPGDYTNWPGYWNETIVTWAPQVEDFILPANFVTGPIDQIADFSNANSSHGFPNSNINYTSGSSYTTSSSHCWTALFVFSGCSSASNTLGTATADYAPGHNLIVTQKFWESGTVLFDAYSRQSTITAESYYQAYAPPINEPASWPSQDTLVPGNSSLYLFVRLGRGRIRESRAPSVRDQPDWWKCHCEFDDRRQLPGEGIHRWGRLVVGRSRDRSSSSIRSVVADVLVHVN